MGSNSNNSQNHRTEKHINGFIRIYITLADGLEFPMLVDKYSSMEYVAKQIEAELWSLKTPRKPLDAPEDWNPVLEQLTSVYQLYDISQSVYPFDALVLDCLKFDDQVTPLTSLEGTFNQLDTYPDEDNLFTLSNSAFSINSNKDEESEFPSSTIGDRLNSILTNTCSLQFFMQFSLAEYTIENSLFWIEIELFRSLGSKEDLYLLNRHICRTFIEHDAPLALNIDDETRICALLQDDEVQTTKYDAIQNFIFLLIKGHAYTRFQNSSLFQKLMEFRNTGFFS